MKKIHHYTSLLFLIIYLNAYVFTIHILLYGRQNLKGTGNMNHIKELEMKGKQAVSEENSNSDEPPFNFQVIFLPH